MQSETQVRHKTRRKQFIRPEVSFASHCPALVICPSWLAALQKHPQKTCRWCCNASPQDPCSALGDFQPSCCSYLLFSACRHHNQLPSVCVPLLLLYPVGFCLLHPVCQAPLSFTAPARPVKALPCGCESLGVSCAVAEVLDCCGEHEDKEDYGIVPNNPLKKKYFLLQM